MSDAFYEQLAVWSQIVASILFIIVLIYIWNRFIAPAVIASQARKNAELTEAERRRDATRAQVESAQADVTAAENEARAIRSRAATDATRLHDAMLADAARDGDRLVQNAHGELERARGEARDRLRTDLLERAMQIARDAAARLDDSTDRRLVAEAVDVAEKGDA
ncbi:MAG: ATP synthase F0 subunit B [Candidatus Eremiobacteraeota bacterium]|nr:ATP synthase F0 subunit B [Candidatus Eremiobacteraeota bacterium]